MSKDKSIYRVFSDLPAIVEDGPPAKLVLRKEVEPDDNTLFIEEMKDVKAMERSANRVTRRPDRVHLSQPAADTYTQLEEAIRDRSAFCVPNLPEYMEGHAEDINPLTMEKLRNGEFSVQKVLDLHGYTASDAYVLFEEFLRDAVGAGLNCVKIIHGRGLKSKAGPVLKEKLKEWIVKAMHRKWVVAFSSSKMCEGGPGATTILLKRTPEKKKILIAG